MHISKKINFFIKKHEKASLVRKNPIVLFFFPIFSKKSRMCTLTPLCHQKRVYMIVIDHKSRLTSIIVEKKIYIFFFSRVEIDNFFFFCYQFMNFSYQYRNIWKTKKKNVCWVNKKKSKSHFFLQTNSNFVHMNINVDVTLTTIAKIML